MAAESVSVDALPVSLMSAPVPDRIPDNVCAELDEYSSVPLFEIAPA